MIAVLSDSHIPRRAERIPGKFMEIVEDSDLAVHCGDFVEEEVVHRLEQCSELVAVKGNCDRFDLQNSATFKRSGISIGVYHGTGIHPRGHLPTLASTAEKLDVDVLFTGHTHEQRAVKHEGKLVLNPGSCTGVRGGTYEGGSPQMLVVEIGDSINVEMMELQDGEIVSQIESFEI